MQTTKLGHTDIEVSRICLGTMTWGGQNTRDEAFEQMDYALERGVNFFDTAELYAVPPAPETQGKTEEFIGAWFAERNNRNQIVLASKITGPGFPYIRGGAPISRAEMETALDQSLKRLQTDYIDLYQLHWPNRPNYHHGKHWDFTAIHTDPKAELDGILEILETFDGFIKAGKIRAAGLSNDSAWGVMKYLQLSDVKNLPRVASVQNEYSLICRLYENDLAEISALEDCGLLAWSPLGGGVLTGKYLDGARPEGSRWSLDDRKLFRDTKAVNAAVKAYMAVAVKHGLNICQMAIAFTLSRPFVTSSIIGATTMDQLKTNIGAHDVHLSEEVLADIEDVRKDYPVPF